MQEILQDLNKEQIEAVLYNDSPLLLLAGAGTGKTKVLTSKIAYIIKSKMAMPAEILATTFTNKAANNMKEKIEFLTKLNISSMWVGTFHSMAYKILRQYSNLIGINSNFKLISQTEQYDIIKKIICDLGISQDNVDPKEYINAIGRYKNGMTDNYELINFKKVKKLYEEKLKDSNSCDFDDLILLNIKLFKKYKEIKEHFNEQFKYVLVDEYQDINNIQYEWLKIITSKDAKITCVGDDDQSIYSWRGAEVGHILKFTSDYKKAKVLKLEKNYRSTSNILEVANHLIANNKHKYEKKLKSVIKNFKEELVKLVECENPTHEVNYIKMEILNLKNLGKIKLFGEVAILLRTNHQIDIFSNIFRKYNIPYKIVGDTRTDSKTDFTNRNFFAQKEGDCINIMTMHSAKGLEFEVVFLPNWNNEIIKTNIEYQNEEEERRLAYVAITRAKNYLYISYSKKKSSVDDTEIEPSKFIEELPEEYLDIVDRSRKNKNEYYYDYTTYNYNKYSKSVYNYKNDINQYNGIDYKSEKSYSKSATEVKKCIHKTFGKGFITAEDGDKLTIVFEKCGKKVIMRNFVKIEE